MVAVLVDIDHFSDVNDGLGQDVGNELLIAITLRLIEHFGASSQLGRIGADVFALVGPFYAIYGIFFLLWQKKCHFLYSHCWPFRVKQ